MDYAKAEAKQAARERFTGLWAAITVPFDAAGAIDETALRADLDRLTGDLAIDGIFSGGVMSEFWALSGAERHRLTEVVVERARGRCPVLAHTGQRAVAARWLQGRARQIDNIASIKAWAGLAGMSGGPVRPPLVSLTAAERAALAADLAAAGLPAGA